MTPHHPSKPQPSESPQPQSVFKEESPQPWEEQYSKKFGNEEFGPLIHTHKFSESSTFADIKQFISHLLLTTKLEMLERVEKEVIGPKPDLERLKDTKVYSDTDRLWWEAVWNTKRKQLAKLAQLKETT